MGTGFWVILVSGAALFVMLGYGLPLIVRWRHVAGLRRAFSGRVALTYDDGPEPFTTPLLLDLLKRRGVRATFFVVGFRAERHPELVDRMVADGHEVACHSHWHRNFWREWPWRGVTDLEQAYRALSGWIPSDAAYRPPRGKLTGWQWLALLRRGAPAVWWTHAVGDTFDPLPDLEPACETVLGRRGDVVLLHCSPKNPDHRDFTLRFTSELLNRAQARGLEVVPMLRALSLAGRRRSPLQRVAL